MKTSEILNRAADAIQERGWTQGTSGWHQEGTPLCLEGALIAATGIDYRADGADNTKAFDEFHTCPAYVAVKDYLVSTGHEEVMSLYKNCAPFTHDGLDVWLYNDNVAESAEDVIAVLRAAAVVESVKENSEVLNGSR